MELNADQHIVVQTSTEGYDVAELAAAGGDLTSGQYRRLSRGELPATLDETQTAAALRGLRRIDTGSIRSPRITPLRATQYLIELGLRDSDSGMGSI